VLSIHKILHPTDYSGLSGPAFEMACSLARDFGAELIICHVSPPPIAAVADGMVVDIPTGEAEQMAARLEKVKPDNPQLPVTHQLLRGDPATEIVRFAAEAGIDLIVLGTHGRGGLSRLLMGSVAEHVLRKALCPVVTVKARHVVEQPKTSAPQPAVQRRCDDRQGGRENPAPLPCEDGES
jgi:nucleotide-binding universal stress UspA family protein